MAHAIEPPPADLDDDRDDDDRDDATDALAPARRAARKGRLLALPGGVLVFLALFLPAVRVCDDPVAPIQFPPAYGPYLLGLAAAIAVTRRRRDLHVAGGFVLVTAIAALGLYGMMCWSELFESDNPAAPPLVIAWSVVLAGIASTFRRGTGWERRAARVLWLTTIGDLVFFAMLIADDGLYGSWVALVGAVLMLLGGVSWDLGARPPPPALPPPGAPHPVPPMRAL